FVLNMQQGATYISKHNTLLCTRFTPRVHFPFLVFTLHIAIPPCFTCPLDMLSATHFLYRII
ncbi:hypothetical protein KI387_021799, partial [Taxus chinensis]